ncbi:sugar ABC transporter substrate-binding protein [Cellvibrio sp. KY-GH-1]|uniref:XrtA/PEP-CTERM system exopolysaccharide export protein n=1 Tax=Cellvibrio sp. KY-GH-1 TaxID=2303332 RepID=UPI001246A56C|nr:sugar ABC transporter substrate-binding protein [Cellvibrio sp. KY-GH-1]
MVACSSTKPVGAPEATTGAGTLPEYRIGVGDSLQISVWRNPELSIGVPVRPDGKISMPLIGDIMAADATATELSAVIVKSLSSYVRNPQVTVIVTNPSSSDFQRRVRITGAVQSPQSIPFREGMTVLDLVLIAGGPNDFASANKAKLYRNVNGQVQVYKIKLDDLINDGDLETNYTLQPSDIVSVPERAF